MINNRRDEQGAVAVVVALLAIVLFGVSALVVDLGQARSTKRQAGNAADAAALSAAQVLAEGGTMAQAVTAAKNTAVTNADVALGEWAGCVDPTPLPVVGEAGNGCITFDDATVPRVVEVHIPDRNVPASFGGAVGSQGVHVTGVAQATYALPITCTICVLGNDGQQNGDIVVNGVGSAGVAVSGDMSLGPNGNINVSATNGSIGYGGTISNKGNTNPTAVQIPTFTDPLAAMPLPVTPLDLGHPSADVAAVGPCLPGTYRDISKCSSFGSGVYILTDKAGTSVRTGAIGSNVLFYLACEKQSGSTYTSRACVTAGEDGATMGDWGSGVVMTGRTIAGYGNFSLIFDRHNTATYGHNGNSDTSITGGIYGASIDLHHGGNATLTFHGILVAGTLSFNGNPSALTDTTTGNSFVTLTDEPYLIK